MTEATVATLLADGARALTGTADNARLEAQLLLAQVLAVSRAQLHAYPEATADAAQAALYRGLIERRAAGKPLAYLTGRREFWSLDLAVTPAVLIPRPETEHVIEVALERLGARGIKINMKTGAPSPLSRSISASHSPSPSVVVRVAACAIW